MDDLRTKIKVIMQVSDVKDNTKIYKINGTTPYILRRSVLIAGKTIKADDESDGLLVSNVGDIYPISGKKEVIVCFDNIYEYLDYIGYKDK